MRTVKWNVTLSGLCGLAVALGVVASGARADVTSEKATSILVFPKVQVDATFDTVIQIANTSNSLIHAHCNYVDARLFDTFTGASCPRPSATCLPAWQETDFDIWLTKQQPTHWLVSGGRRVDPTDGFGVDGSGFDPGRVPPMNPFDGELKCVEITASGEPLLGNHLKGEAIISRISGASADDNVKYNAIGIEGNPSAVASNPLLLDGNIYNACPSKLWLNHFAEFASDPVAKGAGTNATINTELTLVPCSEDFENQLPTSVTVQFLVHNEFEEVFSASTTVTCFLSVRLFDIDSPSLPTQSIFSQNVLGTDVAMTEITPVIQQNGTSGAVIGVARRSITSTAGVASVAHSLVTTGDFIPPAGPDSITLAPRE
ncbi:MAG: hypothetical protein HY270_05475 [Deltaproteobacteria bacterium]|nr:hypothetical protein [Deltaproteobacteria bacterium]